MSDLNHILANRELVEQLMERLEAESLVESLAESGIEPGPLKRSIETLAEGRECDLSLAQEAIIRKHGRPVLYIQDDKVQVPEVLPIWKQKLATASKTLESVIPSIGRIELRGHPRYFWVGTGWLIAPRVVATNRHVAEVFAHAKNQRFEFKSSPDGRRMRASIDMFEEYDRTHEREFGVREVLHIEDQDGPDLALLRVGSVDQDDKPLPQPIPLATDDPTDTQIVGAIGYAGWDGDRNLRTVMDELFEGIYEVKRLHPGEIMETHPHVSFHDCSTLGGNSGSPVIDFATGRVVALHFAGRYEGRNYAVNASILKQILERLNIDPEKGV